MAKDPAFLFYSSDFLTGTALMTDIQVGRYIRLMCLQHQRGHLTEKQMLFITKKPDPDIWEKFEKDSDGLFYNDRLEKEIIKRQIHCQKQSEKIKKYWDEKKETEANRNESGIYHGNTTVLPLENENENRNIYSVIDTEKGGMGEKGKKETPSKHKYGEYENVLLTDDEYSKLKAEYPDIQKRIDRLSEYVASKGVSYKSHYATIRAWAKKDVPVAGKATPTRTSPTADNLARAREVLKKICQD